MNKIQIFQVDAFTNKIFSGNPAAVCPIEEWLPDQVLLSIAAENNLSETAFINIKSSPFLIRWFTPKIEVDLCGHATLASARVMFDEFLPNGTNEIIFNSKFHLNSFFHGLRIFLNQYPDYNEMHNIDKIQWL